MKKLKRAGLLAAVAAVLIMGVVFSDGSLQVYASKVNPLVTVESETETADFSFGDNDALFEQYVSRVFSGAEAGGRRKAPKNTGDSLTGQDRVIYDTMRTAAAEIAAGERDRAEIRIPLADLGIQDEYTAAELGLDYLYDWDTQSWNPDIGIKLNALLTYNMTRVLFRLRADCPYELYWQNGKITYTSGLGWKPGYDSELNPIYVDLRGTEITISMQVESKYRQDMNDVYSVDTARTGAASAAAANAMDIVSEAADKDDFEKLTYYKEQICSRVTYNTAAANGGSAYEDRGAWALVYVFDNDPSTNVVCEGYSEAFQYLCDQTEFNNKSICAYCVTGTLSGGTGAGLHKWNVVHMNDNKNYMADITNSDEGSIGSGGELFLKGISGSVSDGYQVTIQGQNVRYTYDEDTEENFSNEDLTLSGTDYIYETQHSYGDWIIMNEPSCTVPGLRQRVCSNCGDVDTEEIPAKGHTWNTDYTVDQAPTCAEEGSESIHCADCDAVKENSARSIPKTEHEYGSWEVTKEATCTEKGSRKKVCGNCGDIITEEIPAKGHTWNTDYTVDQAATCAEEGSESIHCTDCDAVKEDSARSIPKTKHEHGSWEVTKESTCTEEGSRERVCKNCGSKDIQVISKKPGIELTADAVTGIVNKTYTGKALPQSLVVTVNGKNLKEGTDYKVTYKNNTNAGTASVSVTGLGTYCKTVTKTFKINPKKVTPAVTLSRTAYTCTGKAQKPAVTVKIGSAKLTSAGYQVTWPSGRINVGTYKVTVKLEGNYSGSKSVSYKINPKGTALSGLTAVKAGFKAKWKKQAAQTTGYQLQFSVSGSFPSNRQKTLIISGCGTVTKKVTKLQKKKKYFVRIRTYKKIGKTTYYSTWSGKKSITTK